MHQTEKEVNFFIKKKKSKSGASSLVAIVLPLGMATKPGPGSDPD